MCEYEHIIRHGTLDQLRRLDATKLFAITSTGDTALHIAVACNNIQAMQYLLCEYPKIAFRLNNKYQSPLHVAVQTHNGYIVSVLMSKYPELSKVKDTDNKTALEYAVETGYLEGLMLIFHYNTSAMEYRKRDGNTLLHIALGLHQFQFQIARFLIALFPPRLLEARGSGQHTALHLAVIAESTELVALLCDVCPQSVHMVNFEGKSPFLIAADYSDLERMKLFLNRDTSVVNHRCHNGYNVLHYCAQKEIVELVVAIKPQLLDEVTEDGSSVLHSALEEYCEILLKNKPSLLYVQNEDGETALEDAFYSKEYDKVNVILRFKPNLVNNDSRGNTVLHMAVRAANNEVIALVFANCTSNLYARNKKGKTPFDMALETKQDFAIALFTQHLTCDQVSCDPSLRNLFFEQCCELNKQLLPPLVKIVFNFIGL